MIEANKGGFASQLTLLMLYVLKLVVSLDSSASWLDCLLTVLRTLAGEVPFRFTALTRSCVVIPCSFQQLETLIIKGIWAKQNGGNIYHNAQSLVLDHFKGRTRIVGGLKEGSCSLEIDDIKTFDNGPFCFHVEHNRLKYSFNDSCVFVVMKGLLYFFMHLTYFMLLIYSLPH